MYCIDGQKVSKKEYENYLSKNFLHCRPIYYRKENKIGKKYIYKYELLTENNEKYTNIINMENEYWKTHEKKKNTLYTFIF